jgi:lipoprotein-anchoring transpeptidase ErfK/SrfK
VKSGETIAESKSSNKPDEVKTFPGGKPELITIWEDAAKKCFSVSGGAMLILTVMFTFLALAQTPSTPQQPAYLDALKVQVMVDRAGFSPGVIDGRMGASTKKALAVFREQGREGPAPEPLTRYRITAEDAAGPFVTVPSDMMEKASLPYLGYTSLLEEIAERFHTTPSFLQQLNPDAGFVEGEEIQVPNIEAMVIPVRRTEVPAKEPPEQPKPEAAPAREPAPAKMDVVVTVTKRMSALIVTDMRGRIVFYAPVTTGSKHDPLPIGKWKVNGVRFNPDFHYNPRLFWDANRKDAKAVIPPGPNNPVGLVWIDISRNHYGLHGTPEPSTIGRTESHGCVRLTNWDALKLAALVKPGTRVVFRK